MDEPPRYMGEGFVVMSASKIMFYYYMDEAGLVPDKNPVIQMTRKNTKEKVALLNYN